MRNKTLSILSFSILFLFLLQTAGTLVESIYILALLNTSMDARVISILFFFSPFVLIFFKKPVPTWFFWLTMLLLFLGRGAVPYLDTSMRLLASGVGVAAALLLLPILINSKVTPEDGSRLAPAQGLALAVSLSILLRTLNTSIDYSLTAEGGWVGWVLGLILAYTLAQLQHRPEQDPVQETRSPTAPLVGMLVVVTLMYFAFASPAVIVRWTQANYFLTVSGFAFFTLLWLWTSIRFPGLIARIKPGWLIAWNLLFTLALTDIILAHTVQFPTNSLSAVIVSGPTWIQQIPLVALLVLSPVLYVDFAIFSGIIVSANLAPRRLAGGMLLGSLTLVIAIFMNIFSNVWGYVEPISPWFRNKFWLPFLLLAGGLTLMVFLTRKNPPATQPTSPNKPAFLIPEAILAAILLITSVYAYLTDRQPAPAPEKDSLTVMTYNIQQGNNKFGEISIDQQLALIRQVNPDILGLQESDSARISLNNNDLVRYFASHLGYYAYYGPKTVSGTFGAALLSRYPLENAQTFFTYSDKDENGAAQAEIRVGNQRLAIFNVHPDGSEKAMLAFANTLLQRAASYPLVISIGDYNLRSNQTAYHLIEAVYKEAWIERYPSGVSPEGIDMSGTKRIDHIFVSPALGVAEATYLLAPESHSDHPAHWAVISLTP